MQCIWPCLGGAFSSEVSVLATVQLRSTMTERPAICMFVPETQG